MKITCSRAITLAVGLLILSTVGYAQNLCFTTSAVINVSASPLAKALVSLSSQTGCPIGYEAKLVRPFRSSTVKGRLTPTEALIRMVRGTGLEVHADSMGLHISQADQEAIGLKAATLQASLGQAVKSQKVGQHTANGLFAKLGDVRTSVVDLARSQGFVSAAEKASYQRTFTEVERVLVIGQ